MKKNGYDLSRVTISSDGYGSAPVFDEGGRLVKITYSPVNTNYQEIKKLVQKYHFSLEEALIFTTKNPAMEFGWYPKKGSIQEKSDADFLILDENLSIFGVFALGEICMWEYEIRKKELMRNKIEKRKKIGNKYFTSSCRKCWTDYFKSS